MGGHAPHCPEAHRLRQVVVLGWRGGCNSPRIPFLWQICLVSQRARSSAPQFCPLVAETLSLPFVSFRAGKEAQISATGTVSSNKTNINEFASSPALSCLCRIFCSSPAPRHTERCSCPFSPSFNAMPPSPARRREQSLPNLELIKHSGDAVQNTIHPQGSLNACIHIQMTSVHSEMERSELLITFEEHRNIWTRTSFAPVLCPSQLFSQSQLQQQPTAKARTDHVLAQQDLAQTHSPSPIR